MNIFHYILLSLIVTLTAATLSSEQTSRGKVIGIVSALIFIALIILSAFYKSDCICAALIVMAVHDTEENGRTTFTQQTIQSLIATVNFNLHRIIIVDNNSCKQTKDLFKSLSNKSVFGDSGTLITNDINIGTAAAVNKGVACRKPGEYIVKIDNDVIIHHDNWLEQMQDVMERMPNIGILGLKRVDLMESPYAINTDQRSRLLMVPHEIGQRWRIVEDAKHIMGTCTMLSPQLLDRVGYFTQPNLYGFDDSLMCVRSQVAGFINCFLPHIDIDHIDNGGTPYTKWKEEEARKVLDLYGQDEAAYRSGVKDVYYGGN